MFSPREPIRRQPCSDRLPLELLVGLELLRRWRRLARNYGLEQVIGGLPTRFHLRPCDCSVSRERVAAVQRTLADAILPALGLRTRDSPIYASTDVAACAFLPHVLRGVLGLNPVINTLLFRAAPRPKCERFQKITSRPWPHACSPCGASSVRSREVPKPIDRGRSGDASKAPPHSRLNSEP